ncbi:hypothetical protein N5P37_002569 [Trichoderma harzianum]|uniref:Uncharacterized protein n=1 Tax=Trichoderma harzianum CBS 226.95 TaxID=983964 RepID=A0A2T4AGA2_TRIHA|nr:hypothetical protein M431DRAFT_507612 [Trichoderma harzianum CBS 226.95]KAK0765092.1 hypothetical protein N5P37_002569 [Trichoderma harzianum]PKK49989.1 hypothetical protein CI102_6526 [Trichoderma harzianum]PTB55948.1 hypothetical protein M431DRAFT_507612 [Trichoderma harzianum CBS 226.95]
MDFVNKAMGKEERSTQGTAPAAPQAGGQVQKDDYADKAFSMGAKKSGHNMDRNTQEKITDAGRNMYEKVTGNKVDPKWSN